LAPAVKKGNRWRFFFCLAVNLTNLKCLANRNSAGFHTFCGFLSFGATKSQDVDYRTTSLWFCPTYRANERRELP